MNLRSAVLAVLASAVVTRGGSIVPGATSSIIFTGSTASDPSTGACAQNLTLPGPSLASCTGVQHGQEGDLIVGTTTFSEQAGTFGQSASGSIDYSLEGLSGGRASVTVSLDYFVALSSTALPPLPLSTLKIPIDISISGSVTGFTGESGQTSGFANSNVHESGGGDVEGSVFDGVSGTDQAGNLDLHYSKTGSFIFGFDEGIPMVEVFLRAECEGQPNASDGDRDFSCHALADPTFSFDQAAFDTTMGAQTFNLADYFAFVASDGILPDASGVPEPATLFLTGMGLAAVGLFKRRRG